MNEEINNNKIKSHHIVITVVAVLLAAAIVLFFKGNVNAPEPQGDQTAQVDTTWPSTEVKKETIEENNKQYMISVNYPEVKDENISRQFKEFVDTQITQFKSDTAWAVDPSIAPAEAANLSITIDYTNERSSIADNYIFTIATYTGGAHGLQVTRTFDYSPVGKLLSLTDLFSDNTQGLKAVSDYAISQLVSREIGDESWVKDGAGANVDNYQVFAIGDDSVTFTFDPYQVAPYAAGVQTVTVPLSVFKAFANKQVFIQ